MVPHERWIVLFTWFCVASPISAFLFHSWSFGGEGGDDDVPPTADATVPLHRIHGTQHVHVYIGSPPQRQTLIVDTGSRLMAFPCEPCTDCGKHVSPYFDPAISQTDRSPSCRNNKPTGCLLKGISECSDDGNNLCVIDQKYTEGSSWTAIEKEDLVWLGSEDAQQSEEDFMELAVPYVFGCQTTEQGLFRQQYADGILGIAIHETSIIRSLYEAKSISRNAFSMCTTGGGGTLGLGGVSTTSLHKSPMLFSPIVRQHGWFALRVIEVRLGTVCLTCNDPAVLIKFDGNKGTILDTGTTDSYLPQALLPAFQKAWKQLTGLKYGKRKRRYTYAQFRTLPTLRVIFQGNATLTVPARNYMEGLPASKWNDTIQLTNRIYLDEVEGAVLGGNTMFGNDILFDMQGGRVGIALADCHSQKPGFARSQAR